MRVESERERGPYDLRAERDRVSHASRVSRVWHECWLPCLQCLARLCADRRRAMRTHALTVLQRALLLPAMSEALEPNMWAECFDRCLLPLMDCFANSPTGPSPPVHEPSGFEEMRIRITALISKVILRQTLIAFPRFVSFYYHCTTTII